MTTGIETQEVPADLVQFIKTGSKFIIIGHKEPDGDCVGSQLALRSALLRLGKEAIVCSDGPFKRTELKNYAGEFTDVPAKKKSDVKAIIIDCSNIDRIGSIHKLIEKYPYAIIDHHGTANHPPSTPQAPVYGDANAPACTLLIEKLITALGLEMTEEEASLLLFGLCTDTGFFRHLTERNAAVFDTTAKLIRHGASPKKTFQIITGGKSLSSRILTGIVLSRTESHFDGRLLLCHETLEEFNTFGLGSRDSEIINQLLQSIEGVEATVNIRQECAENCTVSLRSIDKINVAEIAASFGGGGHKNASGLTMQGNISSVRQIMLESFSKVFNC